MKRNNVKSTWMMVRAERGEIIVSDGWTDTLDRSYTSTSVHEWQHDGFVMTHCSMSDHPGERIPDARIYCWSSLSGRPRKLSIREMLRSNVPLDAIKQAISRA
jgi:hypothetical protein